ncbi:hypothetical protein BGZ65_006056 [Modicella reniformis]|uniref:Uncharacterized protein n=1 Tax=Modicella reniformis TaxID=1440133 RepID=A0A9P6LSF6_9FUNG|nr:hypothetical protein BGZ65_006056 [Modicella reniformis]
MFTTAPPPDEDTERTHQRRTRNKKKQTKEERKAIAVGGRSLDKEEHASNLSSKLRTVVQMLQTYLYWAVSLWMETVLDDQTLGSDERKNLLDEVIQSQNVISSIGTLLYNGVTSQVDRHQCH